MNNTARFWFEKVSLDEYIAAWKQLGSTKSIQELEYEWDNIKLPKRATKGSAGYDFYAPCDLGEITSTEITIPTGVRWVGETDGLVLMMYPRSGLGFKYRMQLSNTVGVIDSDYCKAKNEGHIMARFRTKRPVTLYSGDAFMQGVITVFFVSWKDEVENERIGGFGSTDNVYNKNKEKEYLNRKDVKYVELEATL